MAENELMDLLFDLFRQMKEDPSNEYSPNLFKEIIKNNVPVWTAIEATPSVAFYPDASDYKQDRYKNFANTEVAIYIYHRHTTSGLSLEDILTPIITRIRGMVKNLPSLNGKIIEAEIVSTRRDGGTIHPYTLAELILVVKSVESNSDLGYGSC